MNNDIIVKEDGSLDILDPKKLQSIENFATVMAQGKANLPAHLAGNVADCMAVTMQAIRWGMDPYVVGAKTHMVSGNMGYEAQLVNAVITSSTAIDGRFHYEYSDGPWLVSGKNHKNTEDRVRVGARLKGEDEIQWGEWLYPHHVATKNSPLWSQSGAGVKQQAAYLALKYWARMYTPEVIMGVYTSDELEERQLKEINPTGSGGVLDLEEESPIEGEIVDSVAPDGSIEQVNTTTGEISQENNSFMSIKYKLESASTPEELTSAAKLAENIDKESFEFNKLSDIYQTKKAALQKQAEDAANAAVAAQQQQ